jgi:hypothetical protein
LHARIVGNQRSLLYALVDRWQEAEDWEPILATDDPLHFQGECRPLVSATEPNRTATRYRAGTVSPWDTVPRWDLVPPLVCFGQHRAAPKCDRPDQSLAARMHRYYAQVCFCTTMPYYCKWVALELQRSAPRAVPVVSNPQCP